MLFWVTKATVTGCGPSTGGVNSCSAVSEGRTQSVNQRVPQTRKPMTRTLTTRRLAPKLPRLMRQPRTPATTSTATPISQGLSLTHATSASGCSQLSHSSTTVHLLARWFWIRPRPGRSFTGRPQLARCQQ